MKWQTMVGRARLSTFVVALLVLSCARDSATGPPDRDRISIGTWGGDNVGLLVRDSSAHVHIRCTLGNFPAPIAIDDDGSFSVAGEYVLRAYPVQIGPPQPARMEGTLRADRITFTVTVEDTIENRTVVLGPVTVYWAREPRMQICPICSTND